MSNDSQQSDQEKIRELISGIRFAMLTTAEVEAAAVPGAGRLVSRPMTPQRIDDDLTILFITQRQQDVAQQADGRQVNLAFVDKGTFVSVSGTGELRDDVQLKKELWDVATDAYTENGPEDPENVILAVVPDSASYWDSASAPVALVSMLKGALGKEKPKAGDHDTVEL